MEMVLGRDVGPFGRVIRMVAGAVIVIGDGVAVTTHPDAGWAFTAETLGFVGLLAVFYLVLFRVLGLGAMARLDPFVTTVLALGPLGLFVLPVFPDSLHEAVGLYVGASLILNSVIRYGGCEVVALPTLWFRTRRAVYCPFNIADAAERPMRGSSDPLGRGAAWLALVVAGYYLVIVPILEQFDVAGPVSRFWALLLLAPAAVLAYRAWQWRTDRTPDFGLLLGAVAVVLGALALAHLVPVEIVFAAVVLAGAMAAAVRQIVVRRRPIAT